MAAFVIRRVLFGILVLWIISVVVFVSDSRAAGPKRAAVIAGVARAAIASSR